jgi:hypothetical protein
MAITSKSSSMELFYVTRPDFNGNTYECIMSLKELQSEIKRWNNILKIERCILAKGDEISVDDIKPAKYKGKPYTYKEKNCTKENYIGV